MPLPPPFQVFAGNRRGGEHRGRRFVPRTASDGQGCREDKAAPNAVVRNMDQCEGLVSRLTGQHSLSTDGNRAMRPETRFLSRLFGLFLVVVAAAMLLDEPGLGATVTLLVQDRSATLILGLVCLGAGLATVLAHQIWTGGAAAVCVTVLGWVLLLRGALLLFLPPKSLEWLVGMVIAPPWLYLAGAIALGFGGFLTYAGFRAPGILSPRQ